MFEAFLDVVAKLWQTAVLNLLSIIVRAHGCARGNLIQNDLQHRCSIETETTAITLTSLPSEFWGLELDGPDRICIEVAVDPLRDHF